MSVEIAVPALGAIMIGQDGQHYASESENPISVEFRYDPDDALAITVAFLDDGMEVEWTFARELIFEVLNKGQAGADGADVKLSRVLYGPHSVERIALYMNSPDGSALVYFQRRPLASFAEQVEQRLPAAEAEAKFADDIDAELMKLLGQA